MSILNVSGTAIYAKTKQLEKVLQDFLQGGHSEIGPAFVAYISSFLRLRYLGYTIVPIPEKEGDQAFVPAEKVFRPFGLKVSDCLVEKVVEKGEKASIRLCLKPSANLGKRVLLFSCRPNPAYMGKAVPLLKTHGVSVIRALFICE